MVAAGLMFTLMVSLVKVARAEMTALDVVFWRGAAAMPAIFVLAYGRSWRPRNVPWLAARSTLGLFAMIFYFYAAFGLAITDQTLLGHLQPMVIAALAPLVLGRGEGTDLGGWALIALGLVGSAILIAPELRVGSVYGLAALAATGFSALAHLSLRRLTATDDPTVIVLWFQGFVTVASGLWLVGTGTFAVPPTHLWLPLVGVGVLAVIGQVIMTYAYRADRASVVATAAYASPIWALSVDVLAWGVIPSWTSFLGGAIVIGAGVVLVLRRG
jgi:drug/metabolite transporter (DMT)-like permease